jgi:hypothetical protein
MPFRPLPMLSLLCLSVVTLTGVSSAYADEPAPSLYEKRLGIIKGTSKGIVVYDPAKPATPSAAAGTATSTNGKAEVGADGKPATPAAQAPAPSKFLGTLPPPSGRSMAEASRVGAVGGGIALPTARSASQASAEPAAKP